MKQEEKSELACNPEAMAEVLDEHRRATPTPRHVALISGRKRGTRRQFAEIVRASFAARRGRYPSRAKSVRHGTTTTL